MRDFKLTFCQVITLITFSVFCVFPGPYPTLILVAYLTKASFTDWLKAKRELQQAQHAQETSVKRLERSDIDSRIEQRLGLLESSLSFQKMNR